MAALIIRGFLLSVCPMLPWMLHPRYLLSALPADPLSLRQYAASYVRVNETKGC